MAILNAGVEYAETLVAAILSAVLGVDPNRAGGWGDVCPDIAIDSLIEVVAILLDGSGRNSDESKRRANSALCGKRIETHCKWIADDRAAGRGLGIKFKPVVFN